MCILTILCRATDQYPSEASLEDILKFVDTDYYDVPFINNKHYLRKLSNYAGCDVVKEVLIIDNSWA